MRGTRVPRGRFPGSPRGGGRGGRRAGRPAAAPVPVRPRNSRTVPSALPATGPVAPGRRGAAGSGRWCRRLRRTTRRRPASRSPADPMDRWPVAARGARRWLPSAGDGGARRPRGAGPHWGAMSAARTAAAALALVVLTACSSGADPGDTARSASSSSAGANAAGTAGVPTPDHVMVVIFENEDADSIVGGPDAPYLTSLAEAGASFTDAHGETHPSQPNYLAL